MIEDAIYNSRVYSETLKAAFRDNKRIIVNIGGTRSGKTYSILQVLNYISSCYNGLVTSVVTQTFPQLRVGAMRDYQKIVREERQIGETWEENKSEHTFTIHKPDGGSSLMEFFSADQFLKVLGGQRDILFINECIRLKWEVVRQLMVRTSWKVFLDLNPICRFWLNDEILSRDDVAVIHSTYKDNVYLSKNQIAEIETHQKDENWWRVYGLGLEGKAEGLVYPEWDIVPEMPKECKVRYGIDFGYNDPTTLIKVGVIGQDLYLQELIYKRGIITDDSDYLLEQNGLHRRQEKIIYDSAAKEQGETLFRRGWNMHPSVKGGGSILAGISRVKKYRIHIVSPSENLQTEMLNYMWEKDKNDNTMDVPIDGFNHLLDPARYALQDLEGDGGTYSIGFTR